MSRPLSSAPSHDRRRALVGWAVFVLLASVYLLTYSGVLRSVDELGMYALAESLVQTRSTETPQLEFARYHNKVGRIEPLQSVLATPLYWLAVRSARLGNIQTVMLFNVLVTAATGTVLYALLLRLDHPPLRAALFALLFGLATIAWPYSKSFLREPLLALLLTTAAYGLIRWRETRSVACAVLTLACLALALITKVTSFLAWAAFGVAFVFEPGISKRARLLRVLVPVIAGLCGIVLVDVLYRMRLGHGLWRGLRTLVVLDQPLVLLSRLYGLTVGSGRGLFVYSPVLLLAVPGLVLLWHRRRMAAILCLSMLLAFLGGYINWVHWHGGLAWGSRFLAPIVPLLVIPVAECLVRARGPWRVLAILLVALSLVVQFAASTVDYSIQITGDMWADLFSYARSPVVQQLTLWRPRNLDMLWWHGVVDDPIGAVYLDWRIVVAPVLAVLGAALVLAAQKPKTDDAERAEVPGPARSAPARRQWILAALSGLLLVAGIAVLLLRAPEGMVGYPGIDLNQVREAARMINQDQDRPYVVVTISNEFHLNPLLNLLKGRFVHHWFSPLQTEGFDALLSPALPAQNLHLLVDWVHMQPEYPKHSAEYWLGERFYRYLSQWAGEAYQVVGYLYPPVSLEAEPVNYAWEPGMTLTAYGIGPRDLAPGEPLWIEFHLTAAQAPDADYSLFVQLLSPDGAFVNGTDGPPQSGAALTSSWVPGEMIVDRRALYVPADAPPGTYRVIAGFYRNGERQPAYAASGEPIGTHLELGSVRVTTGGPKAGH